MFTLRQTGMYRVTGQKPFTFRSLDRVKTPRAAHYIAGALMCMFLIGIVLLLFVPWRQSVYGEGEIMVFSPMHRPQTVEAQIPGRLVEWYVRDGQTVKSGQLIARLADIDPRFLGANQLRKLQDQRQQLLSKRASAEQKLLSLTDQLSDVSGSKAAAVPAANEKIQQARARLVAAQQSVEAAEQSVKTTQWQLDRISALYDKGLRSQRDQQVALLDNVKAKTELQRAQAAYDVVNKDFTIANLDYKRISADTSASVDATKASIAEAKQVIANTSADIDRLDIDIQNFAQRVEQREVRSPSDGRVVRLSRVGSGETVAANQVLATVVPATEDRAASILIRDWDVPLLSVGREVRLSINGWPSLQFVGWPSIAVGTFAGRIAVIDAVDDGKHNFRVIVVPDYAAIAAKKEEPWPSVKYLRPGAKATGWVLLSDVPLWYELWRQFNGFQPMVHPEPDASPGRSQAPVTGSSEQS